MLTDGVASIRGIGPKKSEILRAEAGIETIEDLLYYIPRRYIDRSQLKDIKDCFVNDVVTVTGVIKNIFMAGKRKKFLEVEINDGTDSISGTFFGGVKYFSKLFKRGDHVLFYGKITFYRKKQIIHPDFDFFEPGGDADLLNTGRIIPLYRSTETLKGAGLDSRGFRRIIKSALDMALGHVTDTLDSEILQRNSLMTLKEAIQGVHFPESREHAEGARKRLAFNEIFFLQYYLSLSKKYVREHSSKHVSDIDDTAVQGFISSLPFTLTSDQEGAIEEIRRDLFSPYPMNRMLQGDVGTGKTVVAMIAVYHVVATGGQAALMAPTEILAMQHYQTFLDFFGDQLRVELLTSSSQNREAILEKLSAGDVDTVIGTHALIQQQVSFNNLRFIIIDEQHRFGVQQRADLRSKGQDVDLLVMTATPIPRSLSLTLYGDLDISTIREKPGNRTPIETLAFPESRLSGVYNSIRKYVSQGRQVFYILPIIEHSEKIDLKSAISVYEHLSNETFPEMNIALLHGRLRQEEKDMIMNGFLSGEIHILVSTTVIEVGIDIANANVIVIEHAERFGLSQLHQLRGRVGRGAHKSFCILIHPDDISEESRKRIETIVSTGDGFKISEEDLKQRGAGDLIGVRQHGRAGSFEFIDFVNDVDLIVSARKEAEDLVAALRDSTRVYENLLSRKYEEIVSGIRKKKVLSILA